MMLWFFNGSAGPPRFIGIHCDQRPADCQLVVLYPDGSEETEHFEDSHTLLDAAKKLGKDLNSLGWAPCPTASGVARRES
jgi:hypothetical protein